MSLPVVFSVDQHEDNHYVKLSPQLANFSGELSYDEAGNANLTIRRKSDNTVMLDVSLDNGEINELNKEFLA